MSTFPFAAVGFDLDGTLVDSLGDLRNAVNHTLGLMGREPVPTMGIRALVGGGSRRMLERALVESGGSIPNAEFEPLYVELLKYYTAHIATETRPYPGCLEALEQLNAEGCRLAVVTNKPEELALKLLDELNMLRRFNCVIGGDTLERGKPHPDMVLAAIEQCGGPFVMVGDSSYDIRAARAAGVANVALSFGYHDLPLQDLGADRVVDHYDELVPALRSLGNR